MKSSLAQLDHAHVWHPFTQMRDWLKREPIVITSGKGAVLRDVHGKEYLDANSSIWTNLHGHQHPKINAAINAAVEEDRAQLGTGASPMNRRACWLRSW
jgi:adenosylmethionine-8-amino-7-oxononanoate aminotransferase